MDAVILATSPGTTVEESPRCLLRVGGRPLLMRILDALPEVVDHVVLVVDSRHAAEVEKAIGTNRHGKRVSYVWDLPPKGTAGALRAARSKIESDDFLVLYGQNLYCPKDLIALANAERSILVEAFVGAPRMWLIREDRVIDLLETARGEEVCRDLGAYHLGKEFFALTPGPTPGEIAHWSLPHTLVPVLEKRPYVAVEADCWLPCGNLDEVRYAEQMLGLRTDPE